MRKLLLLTMAALMMPAVMNAQVVLQPKNNAPMKALTHFKAPAGVEIAENQKIMGHFDSDDLLEGGLGMTSMPGVIPLATVISPDELQVFQGGKIVAFRVGLAEATPVTRVFVAPVSSAGVPSGVGTLIEWPCQTGEQGWNEIVLDTPYEINLDETTSLMIGFDYTQTRTNYPIGLSKDGDIYPTYAYLKTGRVPKWTDMGITSYNVAVQCIVENDNFPEYILNFNKLYVPEYLQSGKNLEFLFHVKNSGVKKVAPGALTFDVTLDGEPLTTISNPAEFTYKDTTFVYSLPVGELESGTHTMSVTMATLNGEPLENPVTLAGSFKVFAESFPRQKHIVEQLTSTYCTYCPLGNSMLSILTAQRNDIIWVGVHGNLNGGVDPYRSAQGDSLMSYLTGGQISYPSGAFDRMTGWEDDVNIVNSLGYYEQYHQLVAEQLGLFFDYIGEDIPSFASINMECELDTASREMSLTVSGDLSSDFDIMMGADSKLTVYLIEDKLVAPQLNSGTWVDDYMHNGVFRRAMRSVLGTTLNRNGNSYSNEFKYTIPGGWNINNLRVVAFVSRPLKRTMSFTDFYITNAECIRLTNEGGGVEELLMDGDAVPVEFYDVMGHRYDSARPGVNIVKMSNGTTRKVLVK
jgi:hypothetical protein